MNKKNPPIDQNELEKLLIDLVKKKTGSDENIDPKANLQELGLTSISTMELVLEVEDRLNIRLPDTLLLECATIRDLSSNIMKNFDTYSHRP